MGVRENQLREYLKLEFGVNKYTKPHFQEFRNSQFDTDIFKVYHQLGGVYTEYPTNFRGFDIQLENLIVELDEERHFNRFRLITLNSAFYTNICNFNLREYRKWCSAKEDICLRTAGWGNNWENKNSKIHFGKSDPERTLSEKGGTRWKQRAFFDFLRDISSNLMKVPILRISIYHKLEGLNMNQHLKRKTFEPIADYIEKWARKHDP